MISLQNHIQRYLNNPQSEIWWPNLASFIILHSERYSYQFESYSTTSIISSKESEPVKVFPVSAIPAAKLEFLCAAHAQLFAKQEVRQVNLERFSAPETIEKIDLAIDLIRVSPTLLDVISNLVKSVHIIQAEPGFDISFTDPELPFSIFISIPTDNKHSNLRLAESIIHEAMHLQLSIIEKEISLVHDDKSKFYSPWKKMLRPTSGIMHALYVFTAIKQWLEVVKNTPEGYDYACYRIREIQEELALLDYETCYDSLTDSGKVLFDTMTCSLEG